MNINLERPVVQLRAELGKQLGIFVVVNVVTVEVDRIALRASIVEGLVADRISIGELEADIPRQSKDEIGELAEAISRMQDSIRLSIERLRRRR